MKGEQKQRYEIRLLVKLPALPALNTSKGGVGSAEEVAEKIIRHSNALGGLSRVSFQMDNAGLSHAKLMEAIQLIGSRVSPLVNR